MPYCTWILWVLQKYSALFIKQPPANVPPSEIRVQKGRIEEKEWLINPDHKGVVGWLAIHLLASYKHVFWSLQLCVYTFLCQKRLANSEHFLPHRSPLLVFNIVTVFNEGVTDPFEEYAGNPFCFAVGHREHVRLFLLYCIFVIICVWNIEKLGIVKNSIKKSTSTVPGLTAIWIRG